ncbi:MAG: DEAD/DEAH box helicase [FCB group bacterium]|nr:DEAD/DEAH box helicase [FCB group bacterium]
MMRKKLAKYDLPEPIVASWEKRFEGRLLPLQYRAVEEYGLLDGQSLLISAPTSSGKTFCGELAIVRAVQMRKKAIFLAPLKAIAEEKYRQFEDCYGELGLRIIISTRDHPEHDADAENGRFDIAVMVYEKFNSLMLTNFDLMGQVQTLVIDELQMLEDPVRGPRLELVLTKLLYSQYSPQIIALSAVLGEAAELAQWLGARLLSEKNRPVELCRGVAAGGKFYYRCHNSGETGEEEFKEGEDTGGALFENMQEILEAGNQVLTFLKSRRETVEIARRFAEFAGLEPVPENKSFFDSRLIDEEPTSLLDNLRSLLACGVTFHNADLTASQRAVVEEGCRAGLIRAIFATTTLSTGINLPAATVFIEAQKYRRQGYTGRPGLEPLSWAEYESMSGRAGRMGWTGDGTESGRAVLFASNELEKSILWDYYIDRRPAPLKSHLASRDTADILVDLFASELVSSPDEVQELLLRTYYAIGKDNCNNIQQEINKQLLEGGFLSGQGGSYTATPLGQAVAITGLSVAGAVYLTASDELFRAAGDRQLLYHLLHAPDGRDIYLPGGGRRFVGGDQIFLDGGEDEPLLRDLALLRRELTVDETNRLRLTWVLTDWMGGMSGLDIENNHNLYLGQMDNLARQTAWLLSSASSVIKAHDRFCRLPERLEELAFSVGAGLPFDLRNIHGDLGELLFRAEFIRLRKDGITEAEQLLDAGMTVLGQLITSPERLHKIEQKLCKIKESEMYAKGIKFADAAMLPQSIEIDGTPVRERFVVRINGQTIKLTGKSFKYLVSLAWSRLTKDNGWLYKEELEQGFNQSRYLYRLRQEIGRDFLPDWPLYENNRSGYYRLMIDRDRIKVNLNALKDIPDFEIQRMASDLVPLMTS